MAGRTCHSVGFVTMQLIIGVLMVRASIEYRCATFCLTVLDCCWDFYIRCFFFVHLILLHAF